jgi:hypothetical protein
MKFLACICAPPEKRNKTAYRQNFYPEIEKQQRDDLISLHLKKKVTL